MLYDYSQETAGHDSGSQPFWHQGLVLGKTVFPLIGVGRMVSG